MLKYPFSLSKLALAGTCVALANFAQAQTFLVNNYSDTANPNDTPIPGTLRWALTQANAAPLATPTDVHTITLQAIGAPPYVIKPNHPLPEIHVPLTLNSDTWAKNDQYIAIDGSNYIKGNGEKACPGAVAGQYGTNVRTMTLPGLVLRDTHNVTLQGVEIRYFCIGVLINRSSNNVFTNNRIMNNYGGAGIMITGDDGKGNPTATTTNNNKIVNNYFQDNGDGLELTRGAAFNLVANNQFISTPTNPEPSQGIEILWGNDNAVIGNIFKNYSDGLQINWGKRNYIAYNDLSQNSIGFNLTGDGNVLDSNRIHGNRIGIALRSEKDTNAHITLTKNQIWDNGKNIQRCEAGGTCVPNQKIGAIVFDVPGLEHEAFVGSRGGGVVIEPAKFQHTCLYKKLNGQTQNCNAKPNQNIQAPTLIAEKGSLKTIVQGQANTRYQVEYFGNDKQNLDETQTYLGQAILHTDNQGQAMTNWKLDAVSSKFASIAATVTDQNGATSSLSQAVRLTK